MNNIDHVDVKVKPKETPKEIAQRISDQNPQLTFYGNTTSKGDWIERTRKYGDQVVSEPQVKYLISLQEEVETRSVVNSVYYWLKIYCHKDNKGGEL